MIGGTGETEVDDGSDAVVEQRLPTGFGQPGRDIRTDQGSPADVASVCCGQTTQVANVEATLPLEDARSALGEGQAP